jgi:nitroreductase
MDFEKLISERYSVRSFRPEHLPKGVIDKILEAAHKAPTAAILHLRWRWIAHRAGQSSTQVTHLMSFSNK